MTRDRDLPAPPARAAAAPATPGLEALTAERTAETRSLDRLPGGGSPDDGTLDRQISERAYFLYLERQGAEGDALADWLEAERQIQQEQSIHG